MSLLELFIIAVGLSMDAFAVSLCKGLASPKTDVKQSVIAGLYFGGFQALMPLLGYLLGAQFSGYIEQYDHWIAFILLGIIGGKMIKEALSKDDAAEKPEEGNPFGVKAMLPLAIATSIDALAMGVSFAILNVQIVPAVCFIGVTTFLFSAAGVQLGNAFGLHFKSKAEICGGVVLILMGLKILLDHLGILGQM